MICSKCHKSKDSSNFSKNERSKTGLMIWCKTCVAAYDKARYPQNKKKIQAMQRVRVAENFEFVRNLKANSPCVDCGEDDPVVLEFDHLSNKRANISDMVLHGFGQETIKIEIEKCEIVCANCHKRRTHKRRLGVTQQQSAWFGTKK
jgi:hypothetical protein